MNVSPAREKALGILLDIEKNKSFANLALKKHLRQEKLAPRDKALVTELVYGTLKTQNTLDWALSILVKRGYNNLPPPILLNLRMAAFQLIYLDRIPHAAVINEAVKLAKKFGHQGTAGLTNGVLRNLARNLPLKFPDLSIDPSAYLSLKYSHPRWLVDKWLQQFGLEDTEKLLIFNNLPAKTAMRTNTLKTDREKLLEVLKAEGVIVEKSKLVPEGLKLMKNTDIDSLSSYQEGLFQVQSEASMMIARVLAPEPGSFVIDACAAPGGKSTHMAQLMHNTGRITAWDIHPHKLRILDANCKRLGINIVESFLQDAAVLNKKWLQTADYILVDAPCSGLGVLRNRPDARWRKEPRQLEELHLLQVGILEKAVAYLKPNGVLLYSTCSLAPEENELVVDEVLQRNRDLQTEDIAPYLSVVPDGRAEQVKNGRLQLLPHRDGTDGFFMARLRKLAQV